MNLVVHNFLGFGVKMFYELQEKKVPFEGYFDYSGLSELVVILLLLSITLIVVITPLVLLGCWIYYFMIYVKKFKKHKDLKHSLIEDKSADSTGLTNASKAEYSKTYSRMLGFGLGIIAYGISSNVYMMLTFSEIHQAFIEYFSFPFRVFRSMKILKEVSTASMPLTEVWKAMLLIVAISVVAFFIGYFIGKKVVTRRLAKKSKVKISSLFY